MKIEEYVGEHIAFSEKTFGPGDRTAGTLDHIRKELVEVDEAEPGAERAEEAIDVIILGIDLAWRTLAGRFPHTEKHILAADIEQELIKKLAKNRSRTWPDWRMAEPGKAIEHVRSADGS